jgi:phosphatidylglycerophosphate synthase
MVLLGIGLLSDLLAGMLARSLGLESDFAARLDQWGDFALWASFAVGAIWLWPEIVRREAPYTLLGAT